MVVPDIAVDYLTVLYAAIASFIFGFLWYSPALFGNHWMKLNGLTRKQIKNAQKKSMAKLAFINFVGTIITAYVLAVFLGLATVTVLTDAVMVGFWAWLGFFASTTLLGSILWEDKPVGLFFLNGAYWLINLVLMSVILTVF